jgi:MFS family permease
MSTVAQPGAVPAREQAGFMSSLWTRRLDRYPNTGLRYFQLLMVVVVTIGLYYMQYVQGSVATQILGHFHMTFTYYVTGLAIANLVGAMGSLVAGLSDRLGRAQLVVYGFGVAAVITLFAIPNAGSKFIFIFLFCIVGVVEGITLVATPALVRDYSPQVGRATAMGFWTMGPVLGSLVVTIVATNTLSTTAPDWRQQFIICGVVSIVVFVLAFFGVRELSPQLRDQLMHSLRERELVEARARGLDVEASLRNPFRQMVKPDIVLSALGISLFLLIYYTLVAFGVIFLETAWGFSGPDANGVSNYAWGADAIGLLLVGLISDRFRVRKPFMLIGGVASAVMMYVFLTQATHHHESYYGLALIFTLLALSLALAYAPWMASFTETAESKNPALTATALAVWGLTIRLVVFGSFLIIPHVVPTVTPLANYGPTVQKAEAAYPAQVATLQKLGPTLATELSNASAGGHTPPPALLAQAHAKLGPTYLTQLVSLQNASKQPGFQPIVQHGATLQNAQATTGGQWRDWYWVCFGGIIAFIPVIFLLRGRWDPRKAKQDALEHDRRIQAELAALHGGSTSQEPTATA